MNLSSDLNDSPETPSDDEAITVKAVIMNLDPECESMRGPLEDVAKRIRTHLESSAIGREAKLLVVVREFSFGKSGTHHAAIELRGTIDDTTVEEEFVDVGLKNRITSSGDLIATAVTNVAHGGSEGILQKELEQFVADCTAKFCARVDDALGTQISSVRVGMRCAWSWCLMVFLGSLLLYIPVSIFLFSNKDGWTIKAAFEMLLNIALLGSLISALPATIAGSLRVLMIPTREIENSPYGISLMERVGLKSGIGVKIVFFIALAGAAILLGLISTLAWKEMQQG